MLYFYSVKVSWNGEQVFERDDSIETKKRLETKEEFSNIKSSIKQDIIFDLFNPAVNEYADIKDIKVLFTAFNPL